MSGEELSEDAASPVALSGLPFDGGLIRGLADYASSIRYALMLGAACYAPLVPLVTLRAPWSYVGLALGLMLASDLYGALRGGVELVKLPALIARLGLVGTAVIALKFAYELVFGGPTRRHADD